MPDRDAYRSLPRRHATVVRQHFESRDRRGDRKVRGRVVVAQSPVDWSQRDNDSYRSRYSASGEVHYRFGDHSSVFVRGLYSLFHNFKRRHVTDVASGQASNADTANHSILGDSAANGPRGIGTRVTVTRETFNRTPSVQLWRASAGSAHKTGPWSVDYAVKYEELPSKAGTFSIPDARHAGGCVRSE